MFDEKKQREMLWEYISILNKINKDGWEYDETKTIYEERKDFVKWINQM